MPLLKELNSHAGANLDTVFRDFSDVFVDSEEPERVDTFECIEEWDGEELRGTIERGDNRWPPSA